MHSVVDLFAGAGGLSLGFCQTKEFDIKVAFENNKNAQKTYKRNHPNTCVKDDVCTANYEEILEKYGKIDVVIGGPPCQGFSNANRQKNHAVSQNNLLVREYVRAILELKPKAFIMENVGMLKSSVHRFYLNIDDEKIVKKYEIPSAYSKIVLIEGMDVTEELFTILTQERVLEEYIWNEKDYLLINLIYKKRNSKDKCEKSLIKHKRQFETLAMTLKKNVYAELETLNGTLSEQIYDYFDNNKNLSLLLKTIEQIVLLQRGFGKAKEIFENKIIVEEYVKENGIYAKVKSYAVADYIHCILESGKNGYDIDSQVLCAAGYGAPQKRNRFVIMGINKKLRVKAALPHPVYDVDEYYTVRDAIEDIEDVYTGKTIEEGDKGIKIKKDIDNCSALTRQLRDSDYLYNHIITNTRKIAMERFKNITQGHNFHSLDESMKINTYADVSRTQNTIYLRLDYDEPSGTVVNVRKSMWIHPKLDRAVSVREAARLQTFPDSYKFEGTKDSQYQQVGNAVPPIMAKAIAGKVASLLNKGGK